MPLLLCFASVPFPLASMGTGVNHAQQDFWLCQTFLSANALMYIQQNVLPMQLQDLFFFPLLKTPQTTDSMWFYTHSYTVCKWQLLYGTTNIK